MIHSCVNTTLPSNTTPAYVSSTNYIMASSTTTKSTGSGEVLPISDIGKLQGKKLSDVEKLDILERAEIPPRSNLPYRNFGKKKRKFNPDFLSTYKWLRYSKILDGCFCALCFIFSANKEGVLMTAPFNDWSNIGAVLRKHQESRDHADASQCCVSFTNIASGKQHSVYQSVTNAYQETIRRNRHVLGEIVQVILLCWRQNIALRGHISETSNFHSILNLLRKRDPVLDNFLNRSPRNAQYISPQVQNELIRLIGQQIQRSILADVREAKWFGFIADETPDVSHIEQVSLSVRYITTNAEMREIFWNLFKPKTHEGSR